MSPSAAAVALQGVLGAPLAIALQGFAMAMATPIAPEAGGGRRRPRRPLSLDPSAPEAPDELSARRARVRALLVAEAL